MDIFLLQRTKPLL